MSRYREQVADAIRAIEIVGPLRYAWLGTRNRAQPPAVRDDLDAQEQREHLLSFIRHELYWSFYCRGGVVPAAWRAPQVASADPELALAIESADTGRGGWERDWTVERVDGSEAVVTANGLRTRVPVAVCRIDRGALEPGARVGLPAKRPTVSPGYLSIVGDAGDTAGALVRVYWHVAHSGAPKLVQALTSRLNREQVPFRLKVGDHPSRFDRCDAAVLYMGHGDFSRERAWLASLAVEQASSLRPSIPAFTFELAPGVGLAEDDRQRHSFGERRCALLAEGILQAHELAASSIDARVAAVVARFRRAGVEIDAPYLEPSLAGRHVF